MIPNRHMLRRSSLVLCLLTSCLGGFRSRGDAERLRTRLSELSALFAPDTLVGASVAPGLLHFYMTTKTGPWAIHLLQMDRSACLSVRAVKASHAAIGRAPTSVLLAGLAAHERVLAGVNADFFSFTPPGVPTGPHIEAGELIVGPGARPVIGFDSAGTPFIGAMHDTGSVRLPGTTVPLWAWNRVAPRGLAFIDRRWGAVTDSGSGRIEVALSGSPLHVERVDTLPAGIEVPTDGALLVAGREASPEVRQRVLGLQRGDEVSIERTIAPHGLREVVGGWPIILRDSAITTATDSAGATFAPVRHPRTAIGIAENGRRLYFLVVDGRQAPYSDGMTLRELATFLRALGATSALNLDGGGSSTMVVADSTGALSIRNRPSDKTERPVGNALAVVSRCIDK